MPAPTSSEIVWRQQQHQPHQIPSTGFVPIVDGTEKLPIVKNVGVIVGKGPTASAGVMTVVAATAAAAAAAAGGSATSSKSVAVVAVDKGIEVGSIGDEMADHYGIAAATSTSPATTEKSDLDFEDEFDDEGHDDHNNHNVTTVDIRDEWNDLTTSLSSAFEVNDRDRSNRLPDSDDAIDTEDDLLEDEEEDYETVRAFMGKRMRMLDGIDFSEDEDDGGNDGEDEMKRSEDGDGHTYFATPPVQLPKYDNAGAQARPCRSILKGSPNAVCEEQDQAGIEMTPLDGGCAAFDGVTTRGTYYKNGGRGRRQRVSFDRVMVRNYAMDMGDHPSCSYGCPVSLSWAHEPTVVHDIDRYEMQRFTERRPQIRLLVLSYYRRRDILRSAGYADVDIGRQARNVQQTKRQRNATQMMLPIHKVEEIIESICRKAKKIGGGMGLIFKVGISRRENSVAGAVTDAEAEQTADNGDFQIPEDATRNAAARVAVSALEVGARGSGDDKRTSRSKEYTKGEEEEDYQGLVSFVARLSHNFGSHNIQAAGVGMIPTIPRG